MPIEIQQPGFPLGIAAHQTGSLAGLYQGKQDREAKRQFYATLIEQQRQANLQNQRARDQLNAQVQQNQMQNALQARELYDRRNQMQQDLRQRYHSTLQQAVTAQRGQDNMRRYYDAMNRNNALNRWWGQEQHLDAMRKEGRLGRDPAAGIQIGNQGIVPRQDAVGNNWLDLPEADFEQFKLWDETLKKIGW